MDKEFRIIPSENFNQSFISKKEELDFNNLDLDHFNDNENDNNNFNDNNNLHEYQNMNESNPANINYDHSMSFNIDEDQNINVNKFDLGLENDFLKEDMIMNKKQKIYDQNLSNINVVSINDFEPIKIIGKGAFGEVRICRFKFNNEVVAVKLISKNEMNKKNQTKHILVERDILAKVSSEWIVSLKMSFQDDEFLYLVMEFMPGGDLMSLLIQREVFDEKSAKIYAAELVLSIESIHKLNAIHRDIKPDNVLIDKNGHVKLSDFGLSRIIVRFYFIS